MAQSNFVGRITAGVLFAASLWVAFQWLASQTFRFAPLGPYSILKCQKCERTVLEGHIYYSRWHLLLFPCQRVEVVGDRNCRHQWVVVSSGVADGFIPSDYFACVAMSYISVFLLLSATAWSLVKRKPKQS